MKNNFFKYDYQYFLDLGATVKIDKENKRKTISLQIKEKLILVKSEAYLSPFLEGKYLILVLNNFATSKIV